MALVQKSSAPEPIDDFEGWINAFTQTSVLIELAALAVCALLAWALVRGLRRALGQDDTRSIWFGRRNVDGVLFPLMLLCLAFVARDVLSKFVSVALLKVAMESKVKEISTDDFPLNAFNYLMF